MKFYPLSGSVESQKKQETEYLKTEYKEGREIGRIRLGKEYFFFRSKWKVYYIPYTDIRRYFRRVMTVPARFCCGGGNFQMEHLVICGEKGELAQIELPGTKAARALMEEMPKLAPAAVAGRPPESGTDERNEGQ